MYKTSACRRTVHSTSFLIALQPLSRDYFRTIPASAMTRNLGVQGLIRRIDLLKVSYDQLGAVETYFNPNSRNATILFKKIE